MSWKITYYFILTEKPNSKGTWTGSREIWSIQNPLRIRIDDCAVCTHHNITLRDSVCVCKFIIRTRLTQRLKREKQYFQISSVIWFLFFPTPLIYYTQKEICSCHAVSMRKRTVYKTMKVHTIPTYSPKDFGHFLYLLAGV